MNPRLTAIFLALLTTIVFSGCNGEEVTKQNTNSQPTAQVEGQNNVEPNLPPPGNPIIGRKPPMPEPERVPRPNYQVETWVSGLVVPWDIAFVSEDRAYITERPGRVRLVENGRLRNQPYATISAVARGEGGLMGIALHPDYPDQRYVYLMYTYRAEGNTYNRVSRFRDTGSGLTDEYPIVTRIPGALFHNGGIIRFGPDDMLYIGTGDAREPELAQDRDSLAGKILRVTPEGEIPEDNPFPGSPVYAVGLRNVQGLAWHPETQELWATMHGPSGEFGLEAKDSIYIIEKGGNHGWPRVLGVTDIRGIVDPVMFFPEVAVPPALATFYDADLMPELRGHLFFASLRGEHLQNVAVVNGDELASVERWFQTGTYDGRYGRLRAVVQGPDGALYVSTSNRGRGNPRPGDDRILRISPQE